MDFLIRASGWCVAALFALPAMAVQQSGMPSLAREPIRPLPQSVEVDERRAALGGRLFADPALSRDGTISCATCHPLDQGGTDHLPRSRGVMGLEVAVNAPTVLNAGFNFRQFWDGRAASLEAQVDGPLQAAMEMGSTWEAVLAKLRASGTYPGAFADAYPDGITRDNVRHAIAEFERSLVTPDAPFDRYLRGDPKALTAAEVSGYRKFKSYGCVSCHQGVNVGGNMYQRMGVMGDYFADRGALTAADFGRFNVTGDEADRFTFKVPSLRNVELTAPYFHDGRAASLPEAVLVMAKYQLGRELPPDDLGELVSFLRTLTGRAPKVKP